MSDEPSFCLPDSDQPDVCRGRYVITFQEDGLRDGISTLRTRGGVKRLPISTDYESSALDAVELASAGGAIFPELGVAVATLGDKALSKVLKMSGDDEAILDVEPERVFYALDDENPLSLEYLRGYRDAVNSLYDRAISEIEQESEGPAGETYLDDGRSTWGLKATGSDRTRLSGRGSRLAILDTGLDLKHPDFGGREIKSMSFIAGQDVQDGNGHGSHCVGTACGRLDADGRRYGVAGNASLLVAKVLSNQGTGTTSGILAGIEWAIANDCHVISMSLGNSVSTSSSAYEAIGKRALRRGSLIVAAAGNARPRFTVGQPANSPSIMAVAAIDGHLKLARFSSRSGSGSGASVDIAAPGVSVYSAWPTNVAPSRYRTLNGTSMATPHVAGIAAMYVESTEARGAELWQELTSRARRLELPAADAGCGLAQAPL